MRSVVLATKTPKHFVPSWLILIVLGSVVAVHTAEKPRVSAGNGTLIIGSYPKQFWIIDEATEKVVGTIPYQSGIPRRTTMTRDRKRFYTIEAGMEKVEIVDIAARKTLDTFTLTEGNKKVRTVPWPKDEERQNANMIFAPDGKLMYLFSDQDVLIYETATFTQVDKWELSRPIEEGFGRLELGSRDVVNDEPGYYTALFTVSDPVQHRRMMGI